MKRIRLSANRWIIYLSCLVAIALFTLSGPIAQPHAYHDFADSRVILGVTNFWNVISNIGFLVIGAWGLLADWRNRLVHDNDSDYPVYSIFFAGVLLTCFGSSWYHLNPGNTSLVWDRLPMTIGFMALTVGLLSEFLGRALQKRLLYPLLLAGFASVIYWHFSEQAGQGDLRPYLLVQFLPLLIIPLVALTGSSRYTCTIDLIAVIGFYALAKLAELLDMQIYQALGVISGHSLKHLLAALAAGMVLRMLWRRRALN